MTQATVRPWARTRADWMAITHTPPVAERQPATGDVAAVAKPMVLLIVTIWLLTFVRDFDTALTFQNYLGFAAAIAGLWWPPLGLLGIGVLAALEPITGPMLMDDGWRWNTLNYYLLFTLLMFLPSLLKLTDIHSRLLQLLLAILVVGLFSSPDLLTGMQFVLAMVTGFAVLIYCRRVGHDPEAWYWLAIVTATLAAVGGAAYFLSFRGAPAVNRNVFCVFPLTAMFVVCVASRFARTPNEQIVLTLLGGTNFVWVFLSASRGGMFIGLLCLLFVMTRVPGRIRRVAFVGLVAAVAVALSFQFADQQAFAVTRIFEMLDTTRSASERTSNRSDLALAGWEIFKQNPLGAGTGGFGIAQTKVALFEWSRTSNFSAHSAWVRILAENGVQGFVVLAAYVCSFALVGWRRRHWGVLRLGLLTTAVLAVTFVSYELEFKAFWLLAAGATVNLQYAGAQTLYRRGK